MNKVYGLVGKHPQALLLEALHKAAFKVEGIDAEYRLFDINPNKLEDLENFCYETELNNIAGFSVSEPFQVDLMRLMDHYDPMTKTVGYLNTVMNEDSLLIGYNTQVTGAMQALQEKTDLNGKKALMLGVKTKGRAICYALKEFGVKVFVWDENPKLAKKVSEEWELEVINFTQFKELDPDIIINSNEQRDASDFGKNPLNFDHFKENMVIMEMQTNKAKTPFMEIAEKAGVKTISPNRLLLHEAAGQFEIWFGKSAPFEEMEKTLESFRI